MRAAWATTVTELAGTDERTVVLDADLASSTKAQVFADAHPGRFFQMGIAEQNMVGVGAGLSTMGYVPWLSSFGVFFSNRAIDPIRMLVAQTGANVKIAAGYTGVCFGMAGKTHHDHADVAVLRAMPGMVVLSPGDAAETQELTRWAHAYDGPVYLRLTRDDVPDLPPAPAPFEPGRLRVLRTGDDGVLVSTGAQTARTLLAAEQLAGQGLELTVAHLPCLKPLDTAGLVALCAGTPLVVTTEEHSVYGGLGGLVAEVLSAGDEPRRVVRIGLDDTWVESGSNEYLLEKYGLTADAVAARVGGLLRLSG